MSPAPDPTLPQEGQEPVRAQDDLFRHVNGAWLAATPIDEDKSSAGSFVTLRDQAQVAVREIVDALPAPRPGATLDERGKIAALYADFMDTDAVERLGAQPLQPFLERVAAIDSPAALARHWGWSLRNGVDTLFQMGTDADMTDPQRHAMFCMQGGLGLPDRDYYLTDEHAETREQYRDHVAAMLGLAGIDDATEQAGQVLELETELARRHWDRVRTRELTELYNPMAWDEFAALAPGLLLDEVLAGAEVDAAVLDLVVVGQPSFFTEAGELATPERLPQWRAWARWKVVTSFAPYLSSAFVEQNFDFYSRTLQGVPRMRPRWRRGVSLVEGVLGEALGRIYVEQHFPPAAKQRMDELVANLLKAYAESISSLDWMGEQTRAEALHKLDRFRAKIGYPMRWRDYDALEVVPGDLVGNVVRAERFAFAHELDKMPRPVDLEEWEMLPQTVNAYYHPMRNEIVFPAAILQPPFFDPQADDATNYGGIGAVIGHEIGHGFDDQGSACDGDGRLRNWWTDEDRAAFTERTRALVAQYDALVPRALAGSSPEPHVNGSLTIGENIGDLGGLTIALKAWRMAQGDAADDEGVRTLLRGYASIWCAKYRDETARQLLVVDPHSPAEFRCNQIASNLDDFHRVFDVQPGDGMWLEPERRVSIW